MDKSKTRLAFNLLFGRIGLTLVLVAGFAMYGLFFTVGEGEAVIVTRLGRPVRVIEQPGPYWRLPAPLDQLTRVDARRQILSTPGSTSFTKDRKSVVIKSYIVWRIVDPLLFVQSTGDTTIAEVHLTGMTTAAKNSELGNHNLSDLLTLRDGGQSNAIELAIQASVAASAESKLGIAIERLGLERITFPEENMPAVLDRMRAEREAEANRLRSEGTKMARKIRDEAHVESQMILRKGKDEASQILADAQRQAGMILAEAFRKDPEFYRFWSSLETCRKILGSNSTLVLRSDQPPFHVLTAPDDAANIEVDSSQDLVAPYLSSLEGARDE